jgi:hypothetical protein
VAIARKKHAGGIFFAARYRRPAGADAARARGASGVATATPHAPVSVRSSRAPPGLQRRRLARRRASARSCRAPPGASVRSSRAAHAAATQSTARGLENGAVRSAGRRRGGSPAAPRVQFSLALPARVGKLTKEFASIGGENLTGVEEE